MKKIIFAFVLCAGFVFACGASSYAAEEEASSPSATPSTPATPSPIDATTFHKEFQDNVFAAEEKYSGKQIVIKGKLNKISKTMLDNKPELTITAGQFKEIECEMEDSEKPAVAKLKKGDIIVVTGKLKKSGVAIVQLGNCTLVK